MLSVIFTHITQKNTFAKIVPIICPRYFMEKEVKMRGGKERASTWAHVSVANGKLEYESALYTHRGQLSSPGW